MSRKKEAAAFAVEVKRADLLQALSRAAAAIERRMMLPVLSYASLAMGFGTLAVTGTNLDHEVRVEIEAKGEGAVCVPAHRLRDMLRALVAETVELKGDDEGIVSLRAGDTEATFGVLPAVDLPPLAIDNLVWSLVLPDGVFAYLIGGAADVMSTEETRYYLNGVCLEVREGQVIAVATDGHRLVSRTTNLAGQNSDRAPIIIPRDTVRLALPLVGTAEAQITAYGAKDAPNKLEIVANGVRIRTKLIDGKFPDWRRVVPAEGGSEIEIALPELARALQIARATASVRGRAVKFEACEGGVRLSTDNPDFGTTATRLACQGSISVPSIGMNADFLAGLARAAARIGSKNLRLQITAPDAPVRIVPDAAIAGAVSVLMPMRV
ncbi:DNA polymerase III subunit beta [Methylorubrum extorquens]